MLARTYRMMPGCAGNRRSVGPTGPGSHALTRSPAHGATFPAVLLSKSLNEEGICPDRWPSSKGRSTSWC
jgi:hypothetical protein